MWISLLILILGALLPRLNELEKENLFFFALPVVDHEATAQTSPAHAI